MCKKTSITEIKTKMKRKIELGEAKCATQFSARKIINVELIGSLKVWPS